MRLLTQADVALVLKVSVKTISRLRQAGELPYIPGKPVLIREADLEKYVERKLTCRARTAGHISTRTSTASTKSDGPSMDDLAAARQAHRIFSKLKRSSRTLSS
ncbi:hypothetical protein BSL82_15880 [Tardibacter chloracetimidivorans]|uniref:Helix-turn-helix domain-containing protein n=1 Tax=Tardibacter chloracetimidivorans TaxID=1921510 RepID=A0A1L3ZY92_9SPHN|nr:hypothetical protein BSL82_15880 [Tardibacter chloracetimidivorans]